MPSSPQLLTLLIAVATGRFAGGVFNCPADDMFTCSSCSSLVYCKGGDVAMELPCSNGQLCGGDPNICRDSADASLTDCKCGTDYPSYVEDPHDDQKFLICLSESLQVPGSCPEGQAFDSDNPPCTSGPTTTTQRPPLCTEMGILPVLPGCGGYYACLPDASGDLTPTPVVDCEDATIFDPVSVKCVDEIDVAQPLCPPDKVAVPDTVECNAFHICNGEGDPISGPIYCPEEGRVFNGETMICEPDEGQVECPVPNPCAAFLSPATALSTATTPTTSTTTPTTPTDSTSTTGSTTTTTGSTTTTTGNTTTTTGSTTTASAIAPDCSGGNGAYPIPGDCKRYYYCFAGKLYTLTCSGQLVFNPNNNTCDLPSNYPECA